MSSPFSTYDEFYNAEGAIYTFADKPVLVGILTVVSALIFIYFLYTTFTIKKGHSDAKSPIILGLLIATSLVSVADTLYGNVTGRSDRPQQESRQSSRSNPVQPWALLGLTGTGSIFSSRRNAKARRRKVPRQASVAGRARKLR